MSILTPFFNLIKPAKTDPQAVAQLNSNFDIIDTEMHKPPLTINGILPDPVNRNTVVNEVPLAANLSSDEAQDVIGTFIQRTSGGNASIADGFAWLVTVKGNSVKTGYVPETLDWDFVSDDAQATLDEDVFRAYVTASADITLTYENSAWSANPELYGFAIDGTPADGDYIDIHYVKENRGVITNATPATFNSTGWNLFDYSVGYARVIQYSTEIGYAVQGTYSTLEFSPTLNGSRTVIVPIDGNFNVPSDGFVFVTGGNDTDTEIYPVWSDWVDPANVPAYEGYTVDTISLAAIMVNFPAGLMSVEGVRDEININTQKSISKILREPYTESNLAAAKASGRPYDTDTDWIYVVRETPITTTIEIDGSYTVSDHGIEYFLGSSVPVMAEVLYGEDLKGKLRRDVLTISAQELTPAQQAQVKTNLGISSGSGANGILTTRSYSKSYTVASNDVASITLALDSGQDPVPTGFVPLSIYSYNSGLRYLYVTAMNPANSNGVPTMSVYNASGASQTRTATMVVTYANSLCFDNGGA